MKYERDDVETLMRFPVRLIVAGTRDWNNWKKFETNLNAQINIFKGMLGIPPSCIDDLYQDVLLISGAARTGADRIVIDYAKACDLDYVEFPADWGSGAGHYAGFLRNTEMSKVGNCLIAYWNCKSGGTLDMISKMSKQDRTVIIPI